MKKNYLFFINSIFVLFIIFLIFFSSSSFASYPKLVSKFLNGFETIKEWLIKIATPAAAVAVRYWYFYEKI